MRMELIRPHTAQLVSRRTTQPFDSGHGLYRGPSLRVPPGLGGRRRAAQAGRLLVPVLGGLAVVGLGLAVGALVVLHRQDQARLQAREKELRAAMSENRELSSKVDELQQAKAQMEEQLTKAQQDLTQAKEGLAHASTAEKQLRTDLDAREQELTRVRDELKQAQSSSQQTTSQLSSLQGERDQLKRQLADLDKAKADLESKIMELTSHPTVELEKVRVTNEPTDPATALPISATGSSDGQVVVVNREYDFIVMNLGKNQGLSVGQQFQVVRNNQVLGTVKVEKIYDELSAATILPNSQKDSIREGDTVKAM